MKNFNRMSKTKILSVIMALAFALPCFSSNIRLDLKRRDSPSNIKQRPRRKSIFICPVFANIDAQKTLSINFLGSLGEVYVEVADVAGNVVYSDYALSDSSLSIMIPMQNEVHGSYLLYIAAENGTEYEGEFCIQ